MSSENKVIPNGSVVGGYRILENIGSGATSIVYRAEKVGKPLALKIMKNSPDFDASEVELRLRREASALSRLNHPSIVKVEEIGRDGNTVFIVMELIEGKPLREHLDLEDLPIEKRRLLLSKVAEALVFVHRSGAVHRDIKPDNILILNNLQNVKLIDFGFVAGEADKESANTIVGTLQYSSPEQLGALSRVVDHRADLYSLGVVIYRSETGRLPFESQSATELIRCHSSVQPPSPRELRPEIRPEIEAIILKLLNKDPDDRYQSAAGLAWDISHLDELTSKDGNFNLDRKSRGQGQMHSLPMIGRDEDMRVLCEKIQNAQNGRGTFTLVEGPSGSGKTRLIDEALHSDAAKDFLTFDGKAQENDASPFGPLREAFDKLLSEHRGDENLRAQLGAAAGENAFLLRQLSRGFDQLFKDAPAVAPLAPELERERYISTIVGFILELAGQYQGLIFHIGDVQWLDAGSREVLIQLSEKVEKSKVVVLMSGRNDSASIEATDSLASALKNEVFSRLTLKKLEKENVRQLVHAFLGTSQISNGFVDRIHDASVGNPFAVTEYLRSMIDDGILYPKGNAWEVVESEFAKIAVSKTVIQLVVERLKKLNESVLQLLESAAVEGMKFEVETLIHLFGDKSRVYRSLEEAVFAGFILKSHDGRFEFVHDSVRESLESKIEADRLQNINQHIAEYRYSLGESTPEAYYRMSKYFLQGTREGKKAQLFEVCLNAGHYALHTFSNEEAFNLLKTAHELKGFAPDDRMRFEMQQALALAAMRTVRFDKAIEYLDESLSIAKSTMERAQVLHLKASVYSNSGDMAQSWDTLRQGLKELGAPFSTSIFLQLNSMVSDLLGLIILGQTNWGFGRAKGEEFERRRMISQYYLMAAYATYYLGNILLVVQIFFKNMVNSHFLGPTPEHVWARSHMSFLMSLVAWKRPAMAYSNSAITLAEQIADPTAVAVARIFNAYAVDFCADTDKADQLYLSAIQYAKKYAGTRERSEPHSAHNHLIMFLGKSQRGVAYYYKCVGELDQWNNAVQRTNFRTAAYVDLTLLGRHKEALEVRKEILEISAPVSHVSFCQCYVYASQIAVLYDRDEMGQELEDNIQAFRDLKFDAYWNRYTYPMIGYVRCRQMLRTPAGPERKKALNRLRWACLEAIPRALTPIHKLHLEILRAYIHFECGRKRRALKLVQKALKVSVQIDSSWGMYEANIALARMADDARTRLYYAEEALRVSQKEGWKNRTEDLVTEFGVQISKSRSDFSPGASVVGSTIRQLKYENQATVLLNVGQALSDSLDFNVQVQVSLSEVRKLLGAERAFLFADRDGELQLISGQDANGNNINDDGTISRTAVTKAFEDSKAVLFAGTKDAEELGSQSAVLHNLRSVLAVPMTVQGKKRGVIYVDSSLAKGMFSNDDVGVLSSVATQIAISLENGRLAALEINRKELEKEMELTSAVQKLFLPKEAKMENSQVRLRGYYRPAARCGGDWWWLRKTDDGRLMTLVGDVTGHGANAAMITATVAACFEAHRTTKIHSLPELISASHKSVLSLIKGEYYMPALAAEVDSKEPRLKCWSAGAPTVFRTRNGSKAEGFAGNASTPVGMEGEFFLSDFEIELQPGDRIYISTDGIPEQDQPDGRQIGERRLMKVLDEAHSVPFDQVVEHIVAQVDKLRGDEIQGDDFAFVVIEVI